MRAKLLVSVVTPAYNAEKYLGETMRSVLAQTYPNFELIIVDDGSTDATAAVVRSFSDPRIRYVHQSNQGQSAARNAALAMAQGKYIAFLDADDLFFPEKLAEQVAYLEANPTCDFCYCKIYHFLSEAPTDRYYLRLEHPSGHLFDKLLRGNFINPLSAMVRRTVFERFGGFNPEFRWADEHYAWLTWSYKNIRFCYLDKPLAAYRLHPENFTNRPTYFRDSQEQCLRILRVVQSWMSTDEIKKYRMKQLERKLKLRIALGAVMARENICGRFLHALYLNNRKRRLERLP